MPSHTPLERVLEQLRLARQEMPEWAEVLELQIALLEAQIAADPAPPEVKLTAAQATERRQQGIPLVTGRELSLPWAPFAALYQRVCRLVADHRPDLALEAQRLAHLAESDLRASVARYLAESRLGSDVEASLLAFCLTHALRPFLRRYAEAYGTLLDSGGCAASPRRGGWAHGYCPLCGGEPDLAALSAEEEGARYLLCARCDTEWKSRRLACPFCDTSDYKQLAYYSQERGPHRLYVCDHCQRYLKAIDLRAAPGRVLLPVERVLTLAMDVAAREQGYS